MIINEELQAVRHAEQHMRVLELQLSRINQDLHSDAIQVCEADDPAPRIKSHLRQCRDELNSEWDRLIELRSRVNKVINQISDSQYRGVLSLRYIEAMSWEHIAVAMHYSWRQIHNIHRKAIAEYERLHRIAHS